MIWLALGALVGGGLALVAVVLYGDRLSQEPPTPDPMLALAEVRRLRAQTVQEMVSAERGVYVPARRYWAVIDGQVVERTAPVEGVDDGR